MSIFPGGPNFSYVLEVLPCHAPSATYCNGAIRVSTPMQQVAEWAGGGEIGIYFELPANGNILKVAIEKIRNARMGLSRRSIRMHFPSWENLLITRLIGRLTGGRQGIGKHESAMLT